MRFQFASPCWLVMLSTFSCACWPLTSPLMVSFAVQKLFGLLQSHVLIFAFVAFAFSSLFLLFLLYLISFYINFRLCFFFFFQFLEVYEVRLFIWDLSFLSSFLRKAFIAMNFPLRTAFAASHKFWHVIFSFLSQDIFYFSFKTFSSMLFTSGICGFCNFVQVINF